MVNQNDGPRMVNEPLRDPYLIIPTEPILDIGRKGHIVRRVSVDEISVTKFECGKITIRKLPGFKDLTMVQKLIRIRDGLIATKRHVECTPFVESTEAVIASPI